MPGIELSGERRLLTIWLILSLLFGYAYYMGFQKQYSWPTAKWFRIELDARQPFVQRFERAYYDLFWSPFLTTEKEGLQVGIIAPRYISSLIDSEMWVWVRNTSATVEFDEDNDNGTSAVETPSDKEPDNNPAILSPLIVVGITPHITRIPPIRAATSAIPVSSSTKRPATPAPEASTPTIVSATPAPEEATPTPHPIEAQVLLREGDNQSDFYTHSRSSVAFTDIYPGETAARLVWVRLLPQAYRRITGDPTELIYLSEQQITGSIEFGYTLWESPTRKTGVLDILGKPPVARINTRQAVMRGFARTLLLPPWSNGLLIGLGLITAFMINLIVTYFDQKLVKNEEAKREDRRNRSSSGQFESAPKNKEDWYWQLIFLIFQIAFWACAIASVFFLTARLTEAFILCPMTEAAAAANFNPIAPVSGADLPSGFHPSPVCVEYPLRPWFFRALLAAIIFFYIGYLSKDNSPRKILGTILIKLWRMISNPGEKWVSTKNFFRGIIAFPEKFQVMIAERWRNRGHASRSKAAKNMVVDLMREIESLHNDLLLQRSNIAGLGLAAEYRRRYETIVEKVYSLPPEANWQMETIGPRLLRDIESSLKEEEARISLVRQILQGSGN